MVDLDVFEINCVYLNNRESMHNYTFPYGFSLEEEPTKERKCECDNRKQKGKREHRQLGGAAKIEREREQKKRVRVCMLNICTFICTRFSSFIPF